MKQLAERLGRNLPVLFSIFFIIFADRISKEIVRQNYERYIVWNTGISLGFLQATGEVSKIILSTIIFVVVMGFMYFLYREIKKDRTNYKMIIPLALVFSGGVSNIIDRLAWGSVLDFIPFFSLWTFNVADFAISLGVIMMLVNKIFYDRKTT